MPRKPLCRTVSPSIAVVVVGLDQSSSLLFPGTPRRCVAQGVFAAVAAVAAAAAAVVATDDVTAAVFFVGQYFQMCNS